MALLKKGCFLIETFEDWARTRRVWKLDQHRTFKYYAFYDALLYYCIHCQCYWEIVTTTKYSILFQEQEISLKCLEQNGYDKDKCGLQFLNYKRCKVFWVSDSRLHVRRLLMLASFSYVIEDLLLGTSLPKPWSRNSKECAFWPMRHSVDTLFYVNETPMQ